MALSENEQKCLDEAVARLASGVCYPSADAYYNDKDTVRELRAKAQGKFGYQTDPMGYWFGRQSN